MPMHATFDQPGPFQNLQAPRNSGGRYRDGRGNLSNCFVTIVDQPFDDAAPDGVGQSGQDRVQVRRAAFIHISITLVNKIAN